MKYFVVGVSIILSSWTNVQGVTEIDLPDLGDSAGSVISPEQEKKVGQVFYARTSSTSAFGDR